MNSMELLTLCLAITVLTIAATAQRFEPDMGDTGGCPTGKVLFSIMDSDGTYKPICLPIEGGS